MNIILPILGLVAGFVFVYRLNVYVPLSYASYLAVAVLAALDTVFGGIRSGLEHRFKSDIFFSGFFVNTVAAGFLAFIGDKIGVPLTLVASIVFGYRIFQNLSLIRFHWITSHRRNPNNEPAGDSEPPLNPLGSTTIIRNINP